MYSADLGRFLQVDPIGYWDDANLYRYCGNNPLNWIDPFGLQDEREPFGLYGVTRIAITKPFADVESTPTPSSPSSYDCMPKLISASGMIISGISAFVQDPMIGALGISISGHALLINLKNA